MFSRMFHTYTFYSCIYISSHSFFHSGHFYSTPSSPLLLRGAPDYSTDTVSEFHAEAHNDTYSDDTFSAFSSHLRSYGLETSVQMMMMSLVVFTDSLR